MKISAKGIELIKRFEGFRSEPYRCSAGVWTIGYGHTGGVTRETTPMSKAEAELFLLRDIARFEQAVNRLITAKLTQNQFDALVAFTFNLGAGALQRSTLRQCLNREEYITAANEFLRWVFLPGGVRSAGLLNRRRAERALFLEV
jgi:lysozyme